LTALIRFKPHGGGILDRNKRDGAVLVLGDTMKSASVWSDMSGRGNHGLVYGAGTPPAATPGALGYVFDGVDDYVDVGNAASLNITNAITVSAWVKPTGAHAGGYGGIWDSNAADGRILIVNDGSLLAQFTIGGVAKSITAAVNSVPLNVYTNVIFVCDGAEAVFWINGAKQTPTAATGTILTSTQIRKIGWGHAAATYFFNGSIDEVRIFNRALSATEIKRLYERTRILFGV